MSISRRTIRRIIQEAIPRGDVPDVVGTVTGVYGEKNRRRLDPNLAIKDFREWAREYGAPGGPNSSSVLATYIVEQELSEAEWMEIAMGMGLTPRDVGLEVVRQQREYDAASPVHESARAGELMLTWNELQVGDLIDVAPEAGYNFYPKVRIIQKVNNVALESGLPPGPGFIGKERSGDEIVFSVDDVDPTSYEKYALAERKTMRVSKRQLKRIVKEEKAKLIRESVSDMDEFEAQVRDSAIVIAGAFQSSMEQLFVEDPEMFQGRSTDEEWSQQVDDAADELQETLADAINNAISRVENQLHDGQFDPRSGRGF